MNSGFSLVSHSCRVTCIDQIVLVQKCMNWFAWSKEGGLGVYLVFPVSCPWFLMSKCCIRKWQVTSQVKRGCCGDCDCERRGPTISQDVTKERPGLLWKFKWKTNVCKHFSHDIRFLGFYWLEVKSLFFFCLKFILSSCINKSVSTSN